MTIRDLHSGKVVSGVLQSGERGKTYKLALSRLSESQIVPIRQSLDSRISGSRIETASWIPGSEWEGTEWEPIYTHAAKFNTDLAALMFGLLVWEAFERNENDWFTERFSMGGQEDRFRVYFRAGE